MTEFDINKKKKIHKNVKASIKTYFIYSFFFYFLFFFFIHLLVFEVFT